MLQSCMAEDSLLSFAFLSGSAMKLSCAGKTSDVKLIDDICGKCGGDNSTCIDCHGTHNGGKFDVCLQLLPLAEHEEIRAEIKTLNLMICKATNE